MYVYMYVCMYICTYVYGCVLHLRTKKKKMQVSDAVTYKDGRVEGLDGDGSSSMAVSCTSVTQNMAAGEVYMCLCGGWGCLAAGK